MIKAKLPNRQCQNKAHYWVLNDKNYGVCKRCGAEKQFPETPFDWHDLYLLYKKGTYISAKREGMR